MNIFSISWIPLVSLLLTMGCGLDDEDRCPDGMQYNPETMTCRKISLDAAVSDTSASQPDSAPAPDATTQDLSPGEDLQVADSVIQEDQAGASGFGADCTDHSQCTQPDVDFCLVNPSSGEGYCSKQDCEPGKCPTDFECCECTGLPMPVVCIKTSELQGFLGSACNCS
jgi:hypothetical protein